MKTAKNMIKVIFFAGISAFMASCATAGNITSTASTNIAGYVATDSNSDGKTSNYNKRFDKAIRTARAIAKAHRADTARQSGNKETSRSRSVSSQPAMARVVPQSTPPYQGDPPMSFSDVDTQDLDMGVVSREEIDTLIADAETVSAFTAPVEQERVEETAKLPDESTVTAEDSAESEVAAATFETASSDVSSDAETEEVENGSETVSETDPETGPTVTTVTEKDGVQMEKVSTIMEYGGVPVLYEEYKPVAVVAPENVETADLPNAPREVTPTESLVEDVAQEPPPEPLLDSSPESQSEPPQVSPPEAQANLVSNEPSTATLLHGIPDAINDQETRRPMSAIADKGFCFLGEIEIIPSLETKMENDSQSPQLELSDRFEFEVVSQYLPVFRILSEGQEVLVEKNPQIDRNMQLAPGLNLYRWSVNLPNPKVGQIYTVEVYTHWDVQVASIAHLGRKFRYQRGAIDKMRNRMIEGNAPQIPTENNPRLAYLRNIEFQQVPDILSPAPVETDTPDDGNVLKLDFAVIKTVMGISLIVLLLAGIGVYRLISAWRFQRKRANWLIIAKSNLEQEIAAHKEAMGDTVERPNLRAIDPQEEELVAEKRRNAKRFDEKNREAEIATREPDAPVPKAKPISLKEMGAVPEPIKPRDRRLGRVKGIKEWQEVTNPQIVEDESVNESDAEVVSAGTTSNSDKPPRKRDKW